MNYKLMLLEIFAILASYLILMLPVAYAYSFSDYLPEEENQFQQPGQNNQIDQANPEPIFKSFVDYFTSSLPELIGGFFSAFSNIVSGFIDTLFPSVRAQSCNYNTTCDSGEDIGSCCYDCGCQNDDYYCDISSPEPPISSSGCKLLSDIGLAYKGPYNIEFTNCNQAHEVNLTVEVVDAPQTMVFESKTFYLNNNQYSGTIWEDCEPGTYQDYYICPITIPVLEDCTEGQHVLSQNSLELNITFRNGRGSGEKSLTTGFPDITINSFTCGNDIYEPELGETPNNCCYDAGCPFNQYCDISNEDRNNQDNRDRGSCEPLLRDVDLTIRNPHPLHFPAHDDIYGDTVSFMAEIFNPPQSISITNTICSIDDASCTLSCSDADSDPDIYNMTCDLTFIIDDYETSQSYLLRPDINISVRYNNASGSINAVLRPNTFTISITESYCGDGYPGPGETQDNCCYDVPCDTDEYCDIVDTSNTSSGTCREDNVAFAIDSTNPTQLTVYTIKEQEIDDSGVVIDVMVTEYLTINVISHINNIPEGRTSLETFCDFGTEDIECFVDEPCGGELIGSDTLNLTCDITIPKIKYRELGSDYYNSQNKQITLNTNTFNLNITFNNGSGQIERSLSDSFDPIIINLIAGCGNDECEAYLDESVNTCCFDCPCPGNQQCIGDYVPGENQCINPEDIVLDITIPDQECTIQALNGECTFLGGIHFGARIYGAPDDLEVIDPDRIKYLHSGITDPEHGVNCDPVPPTQNRDYICTIEDFPDISPEDTDTEK